MVAVLHQIGGGRVIAIDRAVILVGRSADCDVVIAASQKISRRHCCLVQVDNNYYLRDLGSMNGVWLNGERVNREAMMTSGDRISFGDAEFTFHPNARIEQKKGQAAPASGAPPRNGNGSAVTSPKAVNVEPIAVEEPQDADIIEVIDELEVIDDIIPLENDGAPAVGTNEVEIIDDPIIDLDDDLLDDDEIVVLDD